jgi:predicted secreted protein
MPTAAKSSFGTYLKIGDGGTAETFATVAEVLDIQGPSLELETEDVTSHDSTDGWAEHIGTILSGGEVSFEVNWLPANVTQSFTAGLLKDMVGRTRRNFQLVVPAAAVLTWAFTALVTAFEPDLPVKGSQKASITLLITGKPTLA